MEFDSIAWFPLIVALGAGTMLGMVCGLVPGIGGKTGIILAIPFAINFEPYSAAVFLFALHAVIHTSSSIPAISLGMPLSGADAATILDGYPLTKQGRGAEALGASLSASVFGGIFSAVAFILAIPIVRPLVVNFGPPELMLLTVMGLLMIASVSAEGVLKGIVVGIIGVVFAMVGTDNFDGAPRFTFGFDPLRDGFDMAALIVGLFVIPEMLAPETYSAQDPRVSKAPTLLDVLKGMASTLKYKWLVVRSSLYGVFVGLTPAVGASVGVWLAYDYAVRNVPSDVPYGQGAIAGVIAPEATNNAKEGGAMMPSLLLGIPGTSTMAIMMSALGVVGISVGQNMLTRDISLSYILGGTVILANIIAIGPFLLCVPFIVHLARIKRDILVPIVIATSITAALINEPTLSTVFGIGMSTILGLTLAKANWPRTPFILGFVIAPMFERSTRLSLTFYGMDVFSRPLFWAMLLITGAFIFQVVKSYRKKESTTKDPFSIALPVILLFLFAIIIAQSRVTIFDLALFPILISGLAIVFLLKICVDTFRANMASSRIQIRYVPITSIFIISIPFFGVPASSFMFVTWILARQGTTIMNSILISLIFAIGQIIILTVVYDVLIERDIMGLIYWWLLGF